MKSTQLDAIVYDQRFLKSLDILRGLTAMYVMIAHAKWILWEGFSNGYVLHPEKYNMFEKIVVYGISATFQFAHEAVIFFFVLSGFVIHLKQAKHFKVEKNFAIDRKRFYYKRILRIFPPYLFCLLLTFALDNFGKQQYPSLYFGNTGYTIDFLSPNVNFDLDLLLKNLFFIQNGTQEIWGSNQVTWSLQMEWWFYLIYPIFLNVFPKSLKHIVWSVLIISVSSFFMQSYFPTVLWKIGAYLVLWWLGAFLSQIYVLSNKQLPSWLLLNLFGLILAIFVENRLGKDFFLALFFCGLLSLINFILVRYRKTKFVNVSFLTPLSSSSYTLYLIHTPIFMCLSAFYLANHDGRLPNHFNLFFVGIVISLFSAYLLSLLIEKPFVLINKK